MRAFSRKLNGRLPLPSKSMMGKPDIVTNQPDFTDPFLDLIRLLRPQATVWGAILAQGRWGVSFRARYDLLFFRVDNGTCLLLRPDEEPLPLAERDFVLIRTNTPFTLATDLAVKPVDSEKLVASTRSTSMHVGTGEGLLAVIRGGRFTFDTLNEDLLLALLPPLIHVSTGQATSDRTRALLAMNEDESLKPGPGSELVVARLMELLLMELLRGEALNPRPSQAGLLRGLADPVIARALAAMHRNIAKPWTAEQLARLSGCSRSSFNQRFAAVVGVAPMSYLRRWRIAVAKEELRGGQRSVSEIALLVGFQSGGAFSTAFARAVGCSPSRFASKTLELTSSRRLT